MHLINHENLCKSVNHTKRVSPDTKEFDQGDKFTALTVVKDLYLFNLFDFFLNFLF